MTDESAERRDTDRAPLRHTPASHPSVAFCAAGPSMALRLIGFLTCLELAACRLGADDSIDVKPPDEVKGCGCKWVTTRRCGHKRNDGSKCWKICCHAARHGIGGEIHEQRPHYNHDVKNADKIDHVNDVGGIQHQLQTQQQPAEMSRQRWVRLMSQHINATRRRRRRSRQEWDEERTRWLEGAVLRVPKSRRLAIVGLSVLACLLCVCAVTCLVCCGLLVRRLG